MSRPRTLKLEDGTVELQGFSKERADELSSLFSSKEEIPMTELAFSIHKNENTYEVVTVEFDADSGRAKVKQRDKASTNRFKAIEMLRLVLGKYTIRNLK